MNLTKINCPKCNALQTFAPRFRKSDDPKVMIKYIKCTKCKTEWELTSVNYFDLKRERKIERRKK
jgi:hypothetical protein